MYKKFIKHYEVSMLVLIEFSFFIHIKYSNNNLLKYVYSKLNIGDIKLICKEIFKTINLIQYLFLKNFYYFLCGNILYKLVCNTGTLSIQKISITQKDFLINNRNTLFILYYINNDNWIFFTCKINKIFTVGFLNKYISYNLIDYIMNKTC